MNPAVQWVTLLYMMLAGGAMGVAYDSYRVLSLKFTFPKWLNAMLDLLYWLWAALLVFRMLYMCRSCCLLTFAGSFIACTPPSYL